MAKSPTEERQTILSQPQKRPYGAILRVHVQTAGAFGQVEQTEILLATGAFVRLAPARMAPWDGGRKYSLKLEGFPTAAAAEAAAKRLVQAVLWMAVSSDAPLRLDYNSYDPFAVIERMRSEGARLEAYGEAYFQPDMIFDEIKHAYANFAEPDPKVLLSMEIFAGARLEASAMLRVVRQALLEQPDAADAIDQAYALRSQIIHTGRPADLDIDLERESRTVSGIIRRIYATLLGHRLLKPPAV